MNGTPLKWHFPVGLLYDIFVTDDTLPMQVTVHFKKFPDDLLIRFPNKLVLNFNFLCRILHFLIFILASSLHVEFCFTEIALKVISCHV